MQLMPMPASRCTTLASSIIAAKGLGSVHGMGRARWEVGQQQDRSGVGREVVRILGKCQRRLTRARSAEAASRAIVLQGSSVEDLAAGMGMDRVLMTVECGVRSKQPMGTRGAPFRTRGQKARKFQGHDAKPLHGIT